MRVSATALAGFFGCAVSALALSDCSQARQESEWGSATVSGSIPAPVGAAWGRWLFPDKTQLMVTLFEDQGQTTSGPACQVGPKVEGTRISLVFFSGSDAPVTPGTFPVKPLCERCTTQDHYVWILLDAADGGQGGVGLSGTATLTRVDTVVAATFEAQLSAEVGSTSPSLSGNFSGPLCQ
jgi:hypothetical protein